MPWVIAKKNGKKFVPGWVLTKTEVERLDDDPDNTYMVINTGTHQQITIGKGKGRKRVTGISYERGAGESRGGAADEDAVRELVLYIDNDSDLYHRQTTLIMKNLAKRMLKGTYDSAKAVKLWKYLADAGAKKYIKEFGTDTDTVFSVADRNAAARELAEAFEGEVKAGGFDLEKLAKGA